MSGKTADDHAMIVTSTKVLSPSGIVLVDKPVDSVDKLLKVLEWRQRRQPLCPDRLNHCRIRQGISRRAGHASAPPALSVGRARVE